MTAADLIEQELARQSAYWRRHLRVDESSGHHWKRARRFHDDVGISLGIVRFMQFALDAGRPHLRVLP